MHLGAHKAVSSGLSRTQFPCAVWCTGLGTPTSPKRWSFFIVDFNVRGEIRSCYTVPMQPEQQNPPVQPPQPAEWQQPAAATSQAPYQTPAEPVSPAPVSPVTTPVQVPVTTDPVAANPEPIPAVVAQPPVEPVLVADAAPTIPEEPIQGYDQPSETQPVDDTPLLRWQGTEYIHRERGILWFVLLALVSFGLMALALLVFHSITFTLLIPVMAVALVIYVRRPPATLNYTLSRKGLHINDRLYGYEQFKSFGVIDHNGSRSIALIPRKRFQISQVLYFPTEIGESLVDMLAARLPMKEVAPDAIDRVLAKLHLWQT